MLSLHVLYVYCHMNSMVYVELACAICSLSYDYPAIETQY